MLINDNTDIENLMALVVKTARLSRSDRHITDQISKSVRVLMDNGIETAGDLRHRCSSPDWMWLVDSPFQMPMCLAEMIGFLLDRYQEPNIFNIRSPIPINQKRSTYVTVDLGLYGKAPKPYTKPLARPPRCHSLIVSMEKWRSAMSGIRGHSKTSVMESGLKTAPNQATNGNC